MYNQSKEKWSEAMPNAHFDYALGRAVVEILPPQPKNPTRRSWIFSFVPLGTTSFAWHTQHHFERRENIIAARGTNERGCASHKWCCNKLQMMCFATMWACAQRCPRFASWRQNRRFIEAARLLLHIRIANASLTRHEIRDIIISTNNHKISGLSAFLRYHVCYSRKRIG